MYIEDVVKVEKKKKKKKKKKKEKKKKWKWKNKSDNAECPEEEQVKKASKSVYKLFIHFNSFILFLHLVTVSRHEY